uniref:solute carrier family 22 member 5-like n=1 Tax=Styela clava TaxID=7725 RepID=UPI0019396917|nr:solute carrier family 22 member 5-like [Styela clava]
MKLDDIEEKFGGVSRYQIFVIMMTATAVFGTSSMSQSAIFFSAVPDHRCAIPQIDNLTLLHSNTTERNISLFIPPGESCHRYNYNLSVCDELEDLSCVANRTKVGKIKCDNGYVYDKTYFKSTTVSEWDLVCDRTNLDALANSLYFAGVFLGSLIIGPMMDWFGRKLTILIAAILYIATGIASACASSYEMYIFLRVAVAMCGIPCFIAYFTYANEIVGRKSRKVVGGFTQIVTATAHGILPCFAYLVQDWRYLGIMISLFSAPYIIIFFFMPRTPRWLLTHGKENEAKKVLDRLRKAKIHHLKKKIGIVLVRNEKNFLANTLPPSFSLIGSLITISSILPSMVFYGLILNVGKLAGDPYINRVLNGIVELFLHLAGLCCLGTMIFTLAADGNAVLLQISRWIGILGKFFATLAFAIIYQYTAEIYPTIARGTGMGMGSTAARIGSIIMPWTLELQRSVPWLTQTIFGSLSVLAGVLSLLLPETRDSDFKTSMDEAEEFYRSNMTLASRFIEKRISSQTSADEDRKLNIETGSLL